MFESFIIFNNDFLKMQLLFSDIVFGRLFSCVERKDYLFSF